MGLLRGLGGKKKIASGLGMNGTEEVNDSVTYGGEEEEESSSTSSPSNCYHDEASVWSSLTTQPS